MSEIRLRSYSTLAIVVVSLLFINNSLARQTSTASRQETLIPSVCPILLSQHQPNDEPSPSPLPSTSKLPFKSPTPVPRSHSSSRIVGGLPINSTLKSYVALLLTSGAFGPSYCTAVIVGPELIITAAHCVLELNNTRQVLRQNIRVAFGIKRVTRNLFRNSTNNHKNIYLAKETIVHPLYKLSDEYSALDSGYDVAYLVLHKPVPKTSRFMKVNANDSIPVSNSDARSVGYGRHHFEHIEQPNQRRTLHQVDLPITSAKFCNETWNESIEYVDPNMSYATTFCAGYRNGTCEICFGDSGGPIFQYDETNEPVFLGMPSITYGCGLFKIPSRFVRISKYVFSFLPSEKLILATQTKATFSTNEYGSDQLMISLSPTPSSSPTSRFVSTAPNLSPTLSSSPTNRFVPTPSGTTTPSSNKSAVSLPVYLIIIISIGVFLIVLIVFIFFLRWYRSQNHEAQPTGENVELQHVP